jgi:hypothetical protein
MCVFYFARRLWPPCAPSQQQFRSEVAVSRVSVGGNRPFRRGLSAFFYALTATPESFGTPDRPRGPRVSVTDAMCVARAVSRAPARQVVNAARDVSRARGSEGARGDCYLLRMKSAGWTLEGRRSAFLRPFVLFSLLPDSG